jgi:hypothetical protein
VLDEVEDEKNKLLTQLLYIGLMRTRHVANKRKTTIVAAVNIANANEATTQGLILRTRR